MFNRLVKFDTTSIIAINFKTPDQVPTCFGKMVGDK